MDAHQPSIASRNDRTFGEKEQQAKGERRKHKGEKREKKGRKKGTKKEGKKKETKKLVDTLCGLVNKFFI